MVHTPRHLPAPPKLLSNAARWTARHQRIQAGEAKGDWATRDAKRTLREALYQLAHGKCVFCESPLGVSGYLEVEHYVAKSIRTDLAFDWSNLLPACQCCNTSKGDQDHRNDLLKPDVEDPEPFFWINPDGELTPHPSLDEDGQRRARESIRICGLNPAGLCTWRVRIGLWTSRWVERASDSTARADLIEEDWEYLSRPEFPYKLAVRHALRLKEKHQLVKKDKDRFEGR